MAEGGYGKAIFNWFVVVLRPQLGFATVVGGNFQFSFVKETEHEFDTTFAQRSSGLLVGRPEATVIKQKIDSMESGNYAVVQVAEALAKAGGKLVPDIVAGGSSGAGGGTLVDVLLANLLRDGIKGREEKTATASSSVK